MPKSKQKIMAELELRQVNYDEEMSYKELSALLKRAEDKETPPEAKISEPKKDRPPVACGLATIVDHEQRITALEEKLKDA